MAPVLMESAVRCYRCDAPLPPGQGRYHVLPQESYCSLACLRQVMPHVAEAIASFAREPADVRSSHPAAC